MRASCLVCVHAMFQKAAAGARPCEMGPRAHARRRVEVAECAMGRGLGEAGVWACDERRVGAERIHS